MKRPSLFFFTCALLLTGSVAVAAPQQFKVDSAHTAVRFKISHIGFSWIHGRFNDVSGSFTYDPENPGNSSARFTIQAASIDTGHAERDKHLRGEDLFAVGEYPTATFVSTGYEKTGEDKAILAGKLTIKGVTHPVEFQVAELAARTDPWGNFRRGFSARTTVRLTDYNIDFGVGTPSQTAEIIVSLEGVRQ